MEKVTKEQGNAIKTMLAKGMTLREIVVGRVLQNLTVVNGWEHVSVMDLDHLIRALYNGYEVIEEPEVITITPEQKAEVVKAFHHWCNGEITDDNYSKGYKTGARNAMKLTVETLGITWEELQ